MFEEQQDSPTDRYNRSLEIRSLGSGIEQAVYSECDILTVAMRRSGHHAVMHWLQSSFEGQTAHCNDTLTDYAHKTATIRFESSNLFHETRCAAFPTSYDACITNIEDVSLDALTPDGSIKYNGGTFPYYPYSESIVQHTVLVLRDPYNMFASRLQLAKTIDRTEYENLWWQQNAVSDSAALLWIEHAEAFLAEQSNRKHALVVVNYNQWFQSEEYRSHLGTQLGLYPKEDSRQFVSPHGYGSSFDKQQMQGKGTDMNVLKRYQMFTADCEFRDLFRRHPKLQALSQQIFGFSLNMETNNG